MMMGPVLGNRRCASFIQLNASHFISFTFICMNSRARTEARVHILRSGFFFFFLCWGQIFALWRQKNSQCELNKGGFFGEKCTKVTIFWGNSVRSRLFRQWVPVGRQNYAEKNSCVLSSVLFRIFFVCSRIANHPWEDAEKAVIITRKI